MLPTFNHDSYATAWQRLIAEMRGREAADAQLGSMSERQALETLEQNGLWQDYWQTLLAKMV